MLTKIWPDLEVEWASRVVEVTCLWLNAVNPFGDNRPFTSDDLLNLENLCASILSVLEGTELVEEWKNLFNAGTVQFLNHIAVRRQVFGSHVAINWQQEFKNGNANEAAAQIWPYILTYANHSLYMINFKKDQC